MSDVALKITVHEGRVLATLLDEKAVKRRMDGEQGDNAHRRECDRQACRLEEIASALRCCQPLSQSLHGKEWGYA